MRETNIHTLYDVQQVLEKFGIFVHVGKRIWDIELMAIELDKLNDQKVLDKSTYLSCKMVLSREHQYEEKKQENKNHVR